MTDRDGATHRSGAEWEPVAGWPCRRFQRAVTVRQTGRHGGIGDGAVTASEGVRRYYDANTRKFLLAGEQSACDPPGALGSGRHRPVGRRPPCPRPGARRAGTGGPACPGPRLRRRHRGAVPRRTPAGRGARGLDQSRTDPARRAVRRTHPGTPRQRRVPGGRLHRPPGGRDRLRPGLRHRGVRARRLSGRVLPGSGPARSAREARSWSSTTCSPRRRPTAGSTTSGPAGTSRPCSR